MGPCSAFDDRPAEHAAANTTMTGTTLRGIDTSQAEGNKLMDNYTIIRLLTSQVAD